MGWCEPPLIAISGLFPPHDTNRYLAIAMPAVGAVSQIESGPKDGCSKIENTRPLLRQTGLAQAFQHPRHVSLAHKQRIAG